MVTDGVIENYALGGATAAFFYIEPDFTHDVDIFCVLTGYKADAIDMLGPVYEYLRGNGYKEEGVTVDIEGVAVQFLPVFHPLNEEAVANAREFDYQGIPVRVMSPEHLVAIMLQTGRTKDYVRVARFLEIEAFDINAVHEMLKRHGLAKERTNLRLLQRKLAQ